VVVAKGKSGRQEVQSIKDILGKVVRVAAVFGDKRLNQLVHTENSDMVVGLQIRRA